MIYGGLAATACHNTTCVSVVCAGQPDQIAAHRCDTETI
jgi:hypothetical protein